MKAVRTCCCAETYSGERRAVVRAGAVPAGTVEAVCEARAVEAPDAADLSED